MRHLGAARSAVPPRSSRARADRPRCKPRYNRAGTTGRQVLLRPARHRLGVAAPGDRARSPARTGCTSGRCRRGRWPPSSSRRSCSALPLRRCSAHSSDATTSPRPMRPPAPPPRLGVAACPVRRDGRPAVVRRRRRLAVRALTGIRPVVAERLGARMSRLAAQQRFEEAAHARDRVGAPRRGSSHGPPRRLLARGAIRGAAAATSPGSSTRPASSTSSWRARRANHCRSRRRPQPSPADRSGGIRSTRHSASLASSTSSPIRSTSSPAPAGGRSRSTSRRRCQGRRCRRRRRQPGSGLSSATAPPWSMRSTFV